MRRMLSAILLGWCLAMTAGAQQSPFCAEWEGRERVSFDFSFAVPDSLQQSKNAIWLMPYVHNASGDTLYLSPAVFRGRYNRKLAERARFFGEHRGSNEELPITAEKAYHVSLATADYPWLAEGRIAVEARLEKENCCEVTVLKPQCYGHFAYVPAFVPNFNRVPDFTGKAGALKVDNPVLEHISAYRPYDRTRILRKEKGLLYVNFQVAKTNLLRDYRDNAPTLDRIISIARDILADTTSSVKLIQIVGLASAEGAIAQNEKLAQARAVALKKYIQERLTVPDALFELCNGGEGWAELRDQINDTPFEGQPELLEIIDRTEDPNLRERKMKRAMGGKPYRFVKEHILRDQRNSGYLRIYYDYVPDTRAQAINKATAWLQEDRYAEALEVLQTVKADARSWNALGVALYQTGQEKEAINYFRRAAAQGNVDAQRNVEQLDAIEQARRAAR